jgi:hypothetical protein
VDGRVAGGDVAGGDGVGGGAVQLERVEADKRVHIAFVDGLRGAAALYVVLGHVYAYTRVWAEPLLPKPVH